MRIFISGNHPTTGWVSSPYTVGMKKCKKMGDITINIGDSYQVGINRQLSGGGLVIVPNTKNAPLQIQEKQKHMQHQKHQVP